MALLFICLFALLPVVSMKSPIVGPSKVSSVPGGTVSIKCFYPPTSVNRHDRKYWCKLEARGQCITLISSGGFVTKDYAGRANLTNFPEQNMMVVDVTQLGEKDTGVYRCGVGVNNRGLYFNVSLNVRQGPLPSEDPQVYVAEQGGTVNFTCPFQDSSLRKYICKLEDTSCVNIIDSNGNVNPEFQGRVSLIIHDTSRKNFTVSLNHIQQEDMGNYICGTGVYGGEGDRSNLVLELLEPESELVYSELGGSVTLQCALGQQYAAVPKYVCKKEGENCVTVVNTKGNWAKAFEGRVLLANQEPPGSFSVSITRLRKTDAGLYLCGANRDGAYGGEGPLQAKELHVSEEVTLPQGPLAVKGVNGGSVAVQCPYDPKENKTLKYWCRWKGNSHCPNLVDSAGVVSEDYKGRIALFDQPDKGIFTVVLNRLTPRDVGHYWCLTTGERERKSTVVLNVTQGEPSLKAPQEASGQLKRSLSISCHFPCKYSSYEKFWCKWSPKGCQPLPSQEQGPSDAFMDCNEKSRIVSLNLNSLQVSDEGWYWCGVKKAGLYGETAIVYLRVEEDSSAQGVTKESNEPAQPAVVRPENKASGVGQEKSGADLSSAEVSGQGSHVLVSTLVPVAFVLVIGAVVLLVIRARLRKNSDRVSVGSYRTDISMSDFENSRDFGTKDNMASSPTALETQLGEEEFIPSKEDPEMVEEPKAAKRSSKEEADMAYTAFLLQANHIVSGIPSDNPPEV
ncbi:polymeric immunoglobulin receptor [Tachyglossus aculeatus]|uniref:polymeric immunoglobulin receptor n=1 Tax=Tachyglossus aculeatus TaxID=9261 RepID=UPI0018F281D0|nr:polymeric immunoglobulin receptor [Tachyglossus aculeatus]